jgi:hypothetical protein
MTVQPRSVARFLVFGLSFWIVGLILAAFFGFGWFFLTGAVRRLLLAVPQARHRITRAIYGEERGKEIQRLEERAGSRRLLSTGLQGVITLAWIVLTILVFARFNVRLIDILG